MADGKLEFGFSIGFDPPWERQVEKAKLAERVGFDHGWVWDTHILMQEAWVLLSLLAVETERITLGPCVTHTGPRQPDVTASLFATLQNVSDGRMMCGIGRGDSAVRIRKARPANLADVEEAIRIIRGLTAGEEIEIEETPVKLEWGSGRRVPILIGAYGPKALRLAGRVADGVIIQIADPAFVEWALPFVREGADQAGRDLDGFHVQCAAPGFIDSDRERARAEVRWFPALVGNHVADMLRHHDASTLPPELVSFIEDRSSYDYREHTRQGTDHASYVTDEVVDRFTLIGDVAECREKLERLAAAGVTEFNLYTAVSEPEETIEAFGRELIPAVGAAAR
jgi:probable F420-dependent oxidoreductase